jgi:hypothetical protein
MRRSAIGCRLTAAAAVLVGGCTISPAPNSNDNGPPPPPPVTTYSVAIRNLSTTTIDPDIHISSAATTDPAALFVPANKYTRFGVGTRGLLAPGDVARFELDCAAALAIGTPGGLFGDDLDHPDGQGQQRILTQATVFSCGDTITFIFSAGSAGFETSVAIQPD